MLSIDVLEELIAQKNAVKIAEFIKNNQLNLVNGKIFGDEEIIKENEEYWDKKQLVTKIQLNSAYGSLLNKGCRFEDHRIGQSTTLTGRVIVKHMAAKVNEILDGDYNYVGRSIQYGDTDSVIFTAWPVLQDQVASGAIEWTKETVVALYDQIGAAVNESFPEFMVSAFHCPLDNGKIIRCGRELVGSKGLFITKKRYAILIYDKEGKRLDVDGRPGKVKAMGLDLKRSDTPKVVQDFLSSLLMDILSGKDRDHAVTRIIEFKEKFQALQPWHKGTPKRVNNLTSYREKEAKQGKANMPGHVRAALNWNSLREMNRDNYAMRIVDGQKVIVCKLRNNPIGYTSVAYPIDEQRLPAWFLELPFDDSEMEAAIVDKKVSNLLGVLKWDLAHDTNIKNSFNLFFS